MDDDADLGRLREQIASLDREVLDALNRRLGLVARVQEHKQEAGARLIDAKREAERIQELISANAGPLSESAVQSVFGASVALAAKRAGVTLVVGWDAHDATLREAAGADALDRAAASLADAVAG